MRYGRGTSHYILWAPRPGCAWSQFVTNVGITYSRHWAPRQETFLEIGIYRGVCAAGALPSLQGGASRSESHLTIAGGNRTILNKVARPLAVTDESQNTAYLLQPNWNGSIVHPPAHKQSRFQLTRLAARATLPAREGKCALRAQDAHLYKSQFFVSFSGRGAQRRLYLVPNVRNALAAGLARQIPICRNAA